MRYQYILDRWLTKVIVCWTLRVVKDIKVFPIVIIIAVAQI